MREQLIQYVDLLFAGSSNHEDMHQEILQNTLDRYDDLVSQGKNPEAAYRLAISGIGDINEILGSDSEPVASPVTTSVSKSSNTSQRGRWMYAVAISMYICCVLPVIALGNIADGLIGVCLMFLMIAAATVLIILSRDSQKQTANKTQRASLPRALRNAWNTVTLVIFLVLSFLTGAWHITWLVFPIMAAAKGIVQAVLDLKGGK